MKTAIRYVLFAVIAILLNLLSQEMSLRFYSGPLSLYLAILAGTGAGLLSKYFLDKRFIFKVQTENWNDDLNRFALYCYHGLITTLLFWGFELSFESVFATKQARYTGAIIGLTIGYLLKFQLDKRFVFLHRVS